MKSSYSVPRAFDENCLDRIAYPIGGLGAGMFCLDGAGAFSHFSIRHLPDYYIDPLVYSAVAVRDEGRVTARVLEGPVPEWKPLFPWERQGTPASQGCGRMGFGLPRFDNATFSAKFPFATVKLKDKDIPLDVAVTGWSPFVPGDADASGLPAGAVEYHFKNQSSRPLEIVYSFHLSNFLKKHSLSSANSVSGTAGGFILREAGTGETPSREALARGMDR